MDDLDDDDHLDNVGNDDLDNKDNTDEDNADVYESNNDNSVKIACHFKKSNI